MSKEIHERREHDRECGERLDRKEADIREWVTSQICLCKKEIMGEVKVNRSKQYIMLVILLSILGFSVTATVKSFSKSEQIIHNTDDIDDIRDEHTKYAEDVEQTREDVGEIKSYMKQQTQIMKALAREHEIEVDIE